jgi:hypothetical protein
VLEHKTQELLETALQGKVLRVAMVKVAEIQIFQAAVVAQGQ